MKKRGKIMLKTGRYKAYKPKKGKSPGFDYWSRRAGNQHGGCPGKGVKRLTHKIERRDSKRLTVVLADEVA